MTSTLSPAGAVPRTEPRLSPALGDLTGLPPVHLVGGDRDPLVHDSRRLIAALAEAGWQMTPSQANFVWFPLGERTADFVAACTEAGLSVRPYGTEGVRVSIGETEANDRLIEVARAFGPA